jgi:hypothetical protein
MYHIVEFVRDCWVDLEKSQGQPLQRVKLLRGTRRKAEVRPRIIYDRTKVAIEAADLFFEDGSAARKIPFSCFIFPDE